MSKQASLFTTDGFGREHAVTSLHGAAALPTRPIARNSDPGTSHAAAQHHEAIGALGRECLTVLCWLAAWKGDAPTSRELAEAHGADRHMVAKRLSDLEHKGRVVKGEARTCRVGGRQAVTWTVVA